MGPMLLQRYYRRMVKNELSKITPRKCYLLSSSLGIGMGSNRENEQHHLWCGTRLLSRRVPCPPLKRVLQNKHGHQKTYCSYYRFWNKFSLFQMIEIRILDITHMCLPWLRAFCCFFSAPPLTMWKETIAAEIVAGVVQIQDKVDQVAQSLRGLLPNQWSGAHRFLRGRSNVQLELCLSYVWTML